MSKVKANCYNFKIVAVNTNVHDFRNCSPCLMLGMGFQAVKKSVFYQSLCRQSVCSKKHIIHKLNWFNLAQVFLSG